MIKITGHSDDVIVIESDCGFSDETYLDSNNRAVIELNDMLLVECVYGQDGLWHFKTINNAYCIETYENGELSLHMQEPLKYFINYGNIDAQNGITDQLKIDYLKNLMGEDPDGVMDALRKSGRELEVFELIKEYF